LRVLIPLPTVGTAMEADLEVGFAGMSDEERAL
jgi:hypothetical protein